MAEISFNNQRLQSEDGESVLDALLRNNIEVPYSCKAGVCQTCMMRCTQGSVPAESQQELKPNLQKQGFFLSCRCHPEKDIQVELADSRQLYISAKLIEKQQLSPTVYRLYLQTAVPIYYHAGQFVNVKRSDGIIRSYSLASLPSEDNLLELHVKRMENGVMSNWLIDEFNVGDAVDIEGPIGDCFYSNEMNGQALLLVASGTGAAPLLGIIRDAMHNNHTGAINIYHAAYNEEELYLDDELTAFMNSHENINYHACITEGMAEETVLNGHACDIALANHPDLNDWQVFLCGSPAMVKSLQQRAFLAGASLQNIHTDPFETKELRHAARNDTAEK